MAKKHKTLETLAIIGILVIIVWFCAAILALVFAANYLGYLLGGWTWWVAIPLCIFLYWAAVTIGVMLTTKLKELD